MTRGLARHEVSGFKLARLATDRTVAGQGLGGQLLASAALRCLRLAGEGGGILLIIDAKSERVAGRVCQLWRRAPSGTGFDPRHATGDLRNRPEGQRTALRSPPLTLLILMVAGTANVA